MKRAVGDELFFVYFGLGAGRNKKDHTVRITKVGRVWLHLDNGHRVDCNTLVAEGGAYSSPGKCVADRAKYQREVDRDAAWRRFVSDVDNVMSKEISVEMIDSARVSLNLPTRTNKLEKSP